MLTLYPGAGPEVMTSSITAPLERQFGQMPGLNQMTSTSSAGASSVTLQFDLTLSIDIAEQQVQAAINAAGNLLPADLPAPPIYAKVNPADAPILTLAVTSKTDPLTKIYDMVDTRLAQKIAQLPGVGLVSLGGGAKPGVRIRANPTALAAYGLNVDDLRTTIGNANVNTPKGSFDGPQIASTVNANDQLHSAAEYGQMVVAYVNGAPVRLSDVATVVDGALYHGAKPGEAEIGHVLLDRQGTKFEQRCSGWAVDRRLRAAALMPVGWSLATPGRRPRTTWFTIWTWIFRSTLRPGADTRPPASRCGWVCP